MLIHKRNNLQTLVTVLGTIATSRYSNSFGPGIGPILLSNVQCAGNESGLIDCPFTLGRTCTHFEDAGVRCQARLGEPSVLQGRINYPL